MEFPKYIGRPYFVRGYDREISSSSSCGTLASNPSACSALQLLGSRAAFANAELRFPLLRSAYFGLLPFAFPPVEGLFFFDVGAAWRGGKQCSPEEYQSGTVRCGQKLHLTKPDNYDYTTQRYFLSSHGFGIRVNLFNIAIVRWDYSKPLNSGKQKPFWTFSLGPSF